MASGAPVPLAIMTGDSECSARGETADLTVEFRSHPHADGTIHAWAPSTYDRIAANEKDVRMPPISEEARKTRIEEALKALPVDAERIPLPWQDKDKTFPVVSVSLDTVLLNPKSHRIRSQLESHPQGRLVTDSPFSEAAQEIVVEILRNTEGYERLKTNLAEEGQREAGVITRAGLLVNGNTRAAA